MKPFKFVRITKGEHKGYDGEIVDIDPSGDYIVILDVNRRIVKIPKINVIPTPGIKNVSFKKRKSMRNTISQSNHKHINDTKSKTMTRTLSLQKTSRASNSNSKSNKLTDDYFLNLEKFIKDKDNIFLHDVTNAIDLLDLSDIYSSSKVAEDIIEILKNTPSLIINTVDKKLFIIAYFFVDLNKKNLQIPYKPYYKDFVKPNDNYEYILNAAIKNKFIASDKADTKQLEDYIQAVLTYYKISIVPYVIRENLLDKIREARLNVKYKSIFKPNTTVMKIFMKRDSDIVKERKNLRNEAINEAIDKITNNEITIPANVDKNYILKMLKADNLSINEETKSPSKKFLNNIAKMIRNKENENSVIYNMSNPINNKAKMVVNDFINSRINSNFYTDDKVKVLLNYIENIGNNKYFSSLSQNDRSFLEPYRNYYIKLQEIYTQKLPIVVRKTKLNESYMYDKYLKKQIYEVEKNRLEKFKTKYPQYVKIITYLLSNYDSIYNLKPYNIDEIKVRLSLLNDEEKMLQLSIINIYHRKNDIINKNVKNIKFY